MVLEQCATTTVENSMSFDGDASQYAKGSTKYNNLMQSLADSFGVTVASLGDLDIGAPPLPPDSAALFSEGGEAIKLHIEGSLTIPKPGIQRV